MLAMKKPLKICVGICGLRFEAHFADQTFHKRLNLARVSIDFI
jgi:hypothetical protein